MLEPKIVTICGSSRFVQQMAVCGWLLEREEGVICLSLHLLPWWYDAPDSHLAEAEGCAEKMDKLHFAKIEIAHEIFVLNRYDYMGLSTAKEVNHAVRCGKKIRWYTHDPIGRMCERMFMEKMELIMNPVKVQHG